MGLGRVEDFKANPPLFGEFMDSGRLTTELPWGKLTGYTCKDLRPVSKHAPGFWASYVTGEGDSPDQAFSQGCVQGRRLFWPCILPSVVLSYECSSVVRTLPEERERSAHGEGSLAVQVKRKVVRPLLVTCGMMEGAEETGGEIRPLAMGSSRSC